MAIFPLSTVATLALAVLVLLAPPATLSATEKPIHFFGAEGTGERVAIIIDCTPFMLRSETGGVQAFRLIKEETLDLIRNLDPGVVFNVYLYSGSIVNQFQPQMVTNSEQNIDQVEEWLNPINKDANQPGAQVNNFEPEMEYFSGHSYANLPRALHAAFEDQAEAIFIITATWSHVRSNINDIPMTDQERERKLRWEEAMRNFDQQAWDEYVEKYIDPMNRRARELWEEEEAARKAEGRPPRIIFGGGSGPGTMIREHNLRENLPPAPPRPPRIRGNNYTNEEVIQRLQHLINLNYQDQQREPPSLHVILYGPQFIPSPEDFRQLVEITPKNQLLTIPNFTTLRFSRKNNN